MSPWTSNASWILVPTEALGIEEVCLSMAKERILMLEQEKAQRKQWVLVLKNKDLEKFN